MSAETEVKNDDISIKVKQDPGCLVTLLVSLSAKLVQAAYKKALKAVNKEVSLPGFRKGRAPDAMIEKNYGPHIDREWRENLVRQSFEDACELAKLYPFSQDSLKKPSLNKCDREEGAEIEFAFESEPTVPAIDASQIKVDDVAPKSVDDKAVEGTIRDILTVHANWENVEDREVKEGDYVDLDIESLDEPGQMLCKDKRFEVASGRMGEWMKKLLVGAKKGEAIEGVSELEEGQEDEIKNFKPTRCKLTVNTIQEIQLPELDDELAQKVGQESVEALRAAIRHDLEEAAKREARDAMKKQLDDALLDAYKFDIPASIIEAERQVRLKHRIEMMKDDNVPEDAIKAQASALEEEVAAEVDRSLRLYFIVKQVSQSAKIDISHEELVQELTHQLWGAPADQRIVHQGMDPEEMRSRIVSKLMNDKARDHLLQQIVAA